MTRVLQFPQRPKPVDVPIGFQGIYVVNREIVGLIAAKPGQALSLWPESSSHTLATCAMSPSFPVVRSVGADPSAAVDAVRAWQESGAVSPVRACDRLR